MWRPARFFALVLGLAVLLAVFERTAVALRSRLDEAGRGACWIWAPGVHDSGKPVAFYAVRDVRLESLGEGPAHLVISADETYVAFINGRRVGAGAYAPGSAADLYDVTAVLEPGWNRLSVELASRRGAGGLLASLRLGGRVALVTDGDWRVYRRYEAGLHRGWPLSPGEPARVWEHHPTGRWRLAAPAPRPTEPFTPPETVRARRLRLPWDLSRWLELEDDGDRLPEELGAQLLFDWGEEVTGLLSLELATADGTPGFFHVGTEIPDSKTPAHGLVIPVPGRAWWVDVRPRSFRYVLLTGTVLRRAPEVWRLAPSAARQLEPAEAGPAGILGIAPPRTHSRAEERIRRRLRQPEAGTMDR